MRYGGFFDVANTQSGNTSGECIGNSGGDLGGVCTVAVAIAVAFSLLGIGGGLHVVIVKTLEEILPCSFTSCFYSVSLYFSCFSLSRAFLVLMTSSFMTFAEP